MTIGRRGEHFTEPSGGRCSKQKNEKINKQSKTKVLKTNKLKKSENKQQVTPKEIRRKKSIKGKTTSDGIFKISPTYSHEAVSGV